MTNSPFPYTFDRRDTCASVVSRFGALGPGSSTGVTVSVAGRVMLMRPQGKLAFARLVDASGSIQLFASQADTGNFEELSKLSLGDWVGVDGEVITTKKGELSVKVDTWVLLAQARRGFGDKWKGISDPDLRYRQRYVDLWANPSSRESLLMRAATISFIRNWLEKRGFIEIDTPVLHPIAGGATARPFVTTHNTLDMDLYLRIAPELYLKRLVVGGFDRVYEIARVFRNEGMSPRHNPEFTMLELYQAYSDYNDAMVLIKELLMDLAKELTGDLVLTYQGNLIDLGSTWEKRSLSELVSEAIGLEVSVSTDREVLVEQCKARDIQVKDDWGQGKLILELYEKTCEATLWGPIFVTDFPREVSPLARAHRSQPGLTERFELIIAGRELVNAFSELCDPDDQRSRFESQAAIKASGDDEAMEVDEDYLRALEYGLPPTMGLGMGIDRLVMLLADVSTIKEVIAFPTLRPEVY